MSVSQTRSEVQAPAVISKVSIDAKKGQWKQISSMVTKIEASDVNLFQVLSPQLITRYVKAQVRRSSGAASQHAHTAIKSAEYQLSIREVPVSSRVVSRAYQHSLHAYSVEQPA